MAAALRSFGPQSIPQVWVEDTVWEFEVLMEASLPAQGSEREGSIDAAKG